MWEPKERTMNDRITKRTGIMLALACLAAGSLMAEDVRGLTKAVFSVPSTTGNEDLLAGKIRGLLPRGLVVEEDGLGTVAVRFAGAPGTTLILAALDGYGHMVSGITPDGYLTIDRTAAPPHARFDAYLLGQPVIVSTARGPIQGVVSQPAMHLLTQERRQALVENFSLENAFVDIGVRSEREAKDKGVELLDPITFWPALTELAGDKWSGPSLGLKAVAAVLVAVAESLAKEPPRGETVIAWAAQTKAAVRGRGARLALGAVRAKAKWRPGRTILLNIVAAGKDGKAPLTGKGPVFILPKDEPTALRQAFERAAAGAGVPCQFLAAADSPLALPFASPQSEALTVALPVQFLNTPSEVVDLKDLQALRDLLDRFLKTGSGQ
jgi:putative aminopeptidase FrvX